MKRSIRSSSPLFEQKRSLRREKERQTASLLPEYIKESDRAIIEKLLNLSEFKNAETVFLYYSVGREVSTTALIEKLGFELYATSGTASMLNRNMIATNFTYRIHEDKEPNVISLLESGKINYVISTSETGRKPALDSVKIRRKSVERSIACLTSVDTANALVKCIAMDKTVDDLEMVDITKI